MKNIREDEKFIDFEKWFCDGFEKAGYSREGGRELCRVIGEHMERRALSYLPGVNPTGAEVMADIKRALVDFTNDPREDLSPAELMRKILQRYE